MFVSKIAEVDFFLSQVNVLVSEINKKLDQCPVESRNVILPRIYHVVSELEWTMSLTTKDSPNENKEDCTYSGALSPPLSSSSSEESLSWDNYDYYKIYYENDADDEEEDCDVKKCEDDDHGPVQFSASSYDESSRNEEESADPGDEQCEDTTERYSISNPRRCTCVQSSRLVYTVPLITEIDQITVVSHPVHILTYCGASARSSSDLVLLHSTMQVLTR